MRIAENLTGRRFHRWTVNEYAGKSLCEGRLRHFWRCTCDCGTVKTVQAKHLRRGNPKSCGCLHRERAAELGRVTANRNRPPTLTAAERFWPKVEKTDECWLWKAGISDGGYGIFNLLRPHRTIPAHRWAYESMVGPIPDGLELDHLCRVRHCVNPSHLEAVTRRVNTLRGFSPSAQNARKTHCRHGHPLSGDNVRIEYGWLRRCRICESRAQRDYRIRKAAKGK